MLFHDVFHEWSKLDFDLLKMAIFFATVSCFLKEFYISLALLPSADFRLPPSAASYVNSSAISRIKQQSKDKLNESNLAAGVICM